MRPAEVEKIALALFEAERDRVQVALLSETFPGMTLEDAYRMQSALIRLKMASGRSQIGWKIGLTSRAMQQALQITAPDSGVLFDDMLFANGATIAPGRFIEPHIEAELAFVLKAPLAGNVSRQQVIAATDHVVPALEILDTRIRRVSENGGEVQGYRYHRRQCRQCRYHPWQGTAGSGRGSALAGGYRQA